MKKFIILFILIFNFKSYANDLNINNINILNDSIYFDAVEKELDIKTNLSKNMTILLHNFFSKNVKTNGFDGSLTFIIENYKENLSTIDDGKRIDLEFDFKIILNFNSLSQKKVIQGKVTEYSSLVGSFTLNEVDQMVINSQVNLINRLIKKLI